MKVCIFVTNEATRDPRVSRHAETLGAIGHQVLVVCPISNSLNWTEKRELYTIRRCKKYVSIRDLVRPRREKGSVSPSSVTRHAEQSTKSTKSFSRSFLTSAIQTFARFAVYPAYLTWTMWRIGKEYNAHVYLTNDLDTLLAGVLCAMASRTLVHDAHELWPDQFIGMEAYGPFAIAWLRMIEGLLLRRVNVIVTVNEFIAEELHKRYRVRKPRVVLNVPALQHYERKRCRQRRRTSRRIALYQGLFTYHRGLENLIHACRFLEHDVTLVLRGYGPNEHQLRELARPHKNCRFDGPVKMNELISAAANTADVGIVPYVPVNINNYFASPNKLFEYVQAGLPVVGSDLPFLRKIILGNKIGYVFNPQDPRSIAEAINAATRDGVLPTLRNNVLKIRRQYSWSEEQKKLIKIVQELAKPWDVRNEHSRNLY